MPLTPEASLAVDLTVHALGVPVWLDTIAPDPDATKPDRPLPAAPRDAGHRRGHSRSRARTMSTGATARTPARSLVGCEAKAG